MTNTLTSRQREILILICDGKSSFEIGQLIGISPRTVEYHKRAIMENFNVEVDYYAIAEQVEQLKAELATLKEVGPCGKHSRAHQNEIIHENRIMPDVGGGEVKLICTDCERERLIEAAAYRKAAEHTPVVRLAWIECSCGWNHDGKDRNISESDAWSQHILALAYPDALVALDAHVQEKVDRAVLAETERCRAALKQAARERGVENAYNFFEEYLAANRAKAEEKKSSEKPQV